MSKLAALSLLRPSQDQTELLRACLWSGEPARAAWARWESAAGDVMKAIERDHSGVKSLLPVLDEGLRRSGAAADPEARTAIRAAALADTLRSATYDAVAARAFAALTAAAIPFLVLKGAALAVSVYPNPVLRHSHDVDLLLREQDLEPAAQALSPVGFTRASGREGSSPESIALADRSELPLELHAHPYRFRYYAPPLADLWERAATWSFGDATLETLSPADHLVYVCGQASCCASRDSLKWAVDAFYLIENARGLDWEVVLRATRESRLDLPLHASLDFLARDLEAPVPPFVLEALADRASRADRVAREVAFTGIRAGRRGTFRNLVRATPTWRGRLDVARWMTLPSIEALRRSEPLRYPRAWPAHYVLRPLEYLRRRLRFALAGLRQSKRGGERG